MTEARERFKQLKNSAGALNQRDFAQMIGLKEHTVNAIEKGLQKLSVRIALHLKQKIVQMPDGRLRIVDEEHPKQHYEASLRTDWLLYGEGEPFEKTINASNGIKIPLNDDSNLILPVAEQNIMFYTMPDDTMSPEFKKGDFIAVNKTKTDIASGGFYLINYKSDTMFKQLYKIGDTAVIKSLNQLSVPDYTVPIAELEIVGAYEYLIRVP